VGASALAADKRVCANSWDCSAASGRAAVVGVIGTEVSQAGSAKQALRFLSINTTQAGILDGYLFGDRPASVGRLQLFRAHCASVH
jgi:hypothetical protein